jgi:hypothetical protein
MEKIVENDDIKGLIGSSYSQIGEEVSTFIFYE